MRNENQNLGTLSKILLAICAICLSVAIFVPLWRIELSAPQYPEGLMLQIFPHKLGGQVEIINGLNHYIGMKTLHTEDFPEFAILPYLIGFFALGALLVAAFGNKKLLYFFLGLFVVFGVAAMADFYRWNYNYGHNLDPNAAIIVPGMAYQPPLIGYKQLLNFGAFSIPDAGGWLFIVSGVLMMFAVALEAKLVDKFKKNKVIGFAITILATSSASCGGADVPIIKLNADNCDFCKMTIADGRFGAALVTQKGRVYKFDDISCMVHYKNENASTGFRQFYVADFTKSNTLIPVEHAFFIKSVQIASPMRGNIAAFGDPESAKKYQHQFEATAVRWPNLDQE
ncbi:MAG: nitrous oxide reductase accessory protein NosL [Saprospiraceae bacterium]|nr:nitrous oxide reductase accessory protein NosL [Saprospiraceae bacterium]